MRSTKVEPPLIADHNICITWITLHKEERNVSCFEICWKPWKPWKFLPSFRKRLIIEKLLRHLTTTLFSEAIVVNLWVVNRLSKRHSHPSFPIWPFCLEENVRLWLIYKAKCNNRKTETVSSSPTCMSMSKVLSMCHPTSAPMRVDEDIQTELRDKLFL